jgi:Fe-S-cluster containining protein
MESGTNPDAAPLDDLERRARHSGRVRTCQALGGGRTMLSLINIADRGTRIADEALKQGMQIDPPPPSACKEGCDWCCHLTVGTSGAEVIRIVEYLRQNLSAAEFAALRDRVGCLDDERRQRRAAGQSEVGLPCALLVDHRCSAYSVRPLMCGGFNSSDAAECERFVQSAGQTTVPLYAPQLRLSAFVLDGMLAGLSDSGLWGQRVELTAALRIALEVPDAVEKFLAGEPVFAAAWLE